MNYFWFKAAPGLYFAYRGQGAKRLLVGKVERLPETGFYRIRAIEHGVAAPPVERAPWTPRTAMEALQRHIGKPGDVFSAENF